MPASSPYQNNDYQAANSFRPSRLPVNDIMKAYVAQNQFWDQGAQRVKTAYDSALNLSLTLDENKKVKDDYMKEAEKQMSKLSSGDLSDPSVQRQGLNIFKPLLSDRAIVMDNHLTTLRKSILQDAESYKDKKLSKDGAEGEGYNDLNLGDALDGFEDFNSSTPRDEKLLKGVFEKVKDKRYVPFYNVNKTFDEALKNCKGGVNQNTSADGLNDRITKTAGITAAQAKLCIESYVAQDNKALEQIAINGRMNFKNNRSALVQSVQSYLQRDIDDNDAMMRKYQADKLAAINSKTATKEDLDNFDAVINKYSDAKKSALKEYERVSANDWGDIDQNYKSWSQRIYKKSLIENYAIPRATYGTEVSIDGNPGRIAEYNQNAQDARTIYTSERQFELEMMKSITGEKSTASLKEKMELYAKLGMKFDPKNLMFLDKATVEDAETLWTLKEKLSQNYDASYGDLQDISTIMAGIDNAEFVDILKTPPKNQADYAKVIDIANRYIQGRAALLNGTDKLKGKDASLLQAINAYREKIAYSDALHGILENAQRKAGPEKEVRVNQEISKFMNSEDIYTLQRNPDGSFIKLDKQLITDIATGRNTEWDMSVNNFNKAVSFKNKKTGEVINFEERSFFGKDDAFKIHSFIKDLTKINDDYVSSVNTELRGSKALNQYKYKGDKSTDAIVTDNMNRLYPSGSAKQYRYQTMTQDVRTGNVTFQILKKGKNDVEEALSMDELKDLQKELGKSPVSEGSLITFKDGTATMNIASVKLTQESYLDDAIDLLKEDLANRARQQRKPVSQELRMSRKGKTYQLQATPLSTGTVYSIRIKEPGQSSYQTIQDFDQLSAEQVNKAINLFKDLDYEPQIKP
jgi:hypothetical protein